MFKRLLLACALVLMPALAQAGQFVNNQTGTSYSFTVADCERLTTFNSTANPIAGTLPTPAATPAGGGIAPGCTIEVDNRSTGTLVITPTGATIDGQTVMVLGPNQGAKISTDGTNYFTGHSSNGVALLFSYAGPPSPLAAVTTETTLSSYTLPASALDRVGRKIHVHAEVSTAADSNTKNLACYFGTTSIIRAGAVNGVGANAGQIICDLIVTKTGASTQISYGTVIVYQTPIQPATPNVEVASASGTDTDTASITIKATGTQGAATGGDIVFNDFYVEYLN